VSLFRGDQIIRLVIFLGGFPSSVKGSYDPSQFRLVAHGVHTLTQVVKENAVYPRLFRGGAQE
jgi:hypothetical protein